MTAVRMFSEPETDLSRLKGKRVAIIGYGSQGHAHALNLRDNGVDVVVGLRVNGRTAEAARAAGFEVQEVAKAVAASDVIAILVPDTVQAALYRDAIAPALRKGATLLFAHGFNIHFKQIVPPAHADVVLVAPKSPGNMVRREFVAGQGVPALVGVHQNATGKALETALAYAAGIGCARAGLLETDFAAETITDLFGEQAVLCGGMSALIKAGFDTLVEAGYPPELAYFECLHETKLIVDLIYAGGLSGMRGGVSDTAEYGDYVSGPRVVGDASRKAMKQILGEIQSGEFAKQWIAEAAGGSKEFNRMREQEKKHPIEAVGKKLRARMAWLASD